MSKILFIVDEWPFPPRNGITIPVSNYINYLSLENDIVILLLSKDGELPSDTKGFNVISLKIEGSKFSIFKELFFIRPNFLHNINEVDLIRSFKKHKFDYLISSPISCIAVAIKLKNILYKDSNNSPKLMAAISDAYSLVLEKSFSKQQGISLRNFVKYIRSYQMRVFEHQLLKKSDKVYVQSSNDARRIAFLSKKLASKVSILHNGVDDVLLSNKVIEFKDYTEIRFLFCGSQTSLGHYESQILEFYTNVWLKVRSEGKVLVIKGGGINLELKQFQALKHDDSVVFDNKFYDDVSDIYSERHCLIAPIYKGYGFINKVAEAMACGLLVIGDKTAFNGMESFENYHHGIIANNSSEFIAAMNDFSNEPTKYSQLRKNAVTFSRNHFAWNEKLKTFLKI